MSQDQVNPFDAPKDDVAVEGVIASEDSGDLYARLSWGGTPKLFILGAITLGIYLAHYIRRQTDILNEYVEEDNKISSGLITAILLTSYGTVVFALVIMFGDFSQQVVDLSDFADLINSILLIVWGFKFRNRMNAMNGMPKGEKTWFHGFWTFLFTALYVNYKVNQFNETQVVEE